MKRFSKTITEEVKKLISKAENITLIPHLNPDGDAIGSCMGLYRVLKNAGKRCSIVSPNDYPDFLKWMPGTDEVNIFEYSKDKCIRILNSAGLFLFLDFNELKRTGGLEDYLKNSETKKIMIDHHPNPFDIAEYILSDTSASSTAELVFNLIEQLSLSKFIDKDAAEAFFTGIITDTGSFSYNVSSQNVYQVAAKLIEKGADKDKIHSALFHNFSTHRLKLLGYSLDRKMVVLPGYHTAFISLTADELKDYNFQLGDTEGFVNYPLSINGIIFSAFFMEQDDIVKISFRSKGQFPVNKFSSKHFNGGGHTNASGGNSEDNMETTIDKFCKLLPEYKENLQKEAQNLL